MPALLALIAVTAVWGYTFVQVKDAVAVYPLFAFLAVRFVIASLMLAVPRRRGCGRSAVDGWTAGVALGLLLGLGYALQTAGLERTTVSSAGFITGLYVVFTPLLALLLFRTRVGRRGWLGVALSVRRACAARGGRRGRSARRPARAARLRRVLASDRVDGAIRAALRPVAFTQAEMLAAFAGFLSSRSRSASSRCRADGRSGARCSSPAIFASALAFLVQTWANGG